MYDLRGFFGIAFPTNLPDRINHDRVFGKGDGYRLFGKRHRHGNIRRDALRDDDFFRVRIGLGRHRLRLRHVKLHAQIHLFDLLADDEFPPTADASENAVPSRSGK